MSAAFDQLFVYAIRLKLDPVGASSHSVGMVGELLLLLSRKNWNDYITSMAREELMEFVFEISDGEWQQCRSYAINEMCDRATAERHVDAYDPQLSFAGYEEGMYRESFKWFRHVESIRSI